MRAWLALLLLLPLAGCLSGNGLQEVADEPADPWSDAVVAGGAYAFEQRARVLSLRLVDEGLPDASWSVEVYEPDDRRVGLFTLNATRSQVDIRGISPGLAVLRIHEANGTLQVMDGDVPVTAFHQLPVHVERHVLLDRDALGVQPLGTHPLPSTTRDITLERTATALRLLASGSVDRLRVEVHDLQGPVLEVDASRLTVPLLQGGLAEVPASFFPQNLEQPDLRVTMSAEHADGVVVLEASSYSRAFVPNELLEHAAGAAGFTYGTVEQRPVRFQVHAGAEHIVLTAASEAQFILWGPDDVRMAAASLSPGEHVAIAPRGGGDHVLYAVAGTVQVGTDRVPADFELHPLPLETWRPPTIAGEGYIQEEIAVDTPGVPFQVTFTEAPLLACMSDPFLRIRQANETLGAYAWGRELHPAPWLGGGPLALGVEGLAPYGCLDVPIRITSWVRPP